MNLRAGLSAALLIALELAGSKAIAEPVTSEQLRTYAMIGAMNICVLNTLDVDYEKSLLASAVAITRVIQDQHDNQFKGFEGKDQLWSTEEDVRQGVAVQVSLLTNYYCRDKLSGTNREKLDKVLKKAEESGLKITY